MAGSIIQNLLRLFRGIPRIFEGGIAAAALIAHGIGYRLRPQRPNEILHDGGIFRVIEAKLFAGTQQQAAIIGTNFPSGQGLFHLFLQGFPADFIPQNLQVMHNLCLSAIGSFQPEIVVDLLADVTLGAHIVVDTPENMVTGRTHGYQLPTGLTRRAQCPDRRKPCCNLVPCHGINAAAALPVWNFLQPDAQCLSRLPATVIQCCARCFQCAAWKITVCHDWSLRIKSFLLGGILRQISHLLKIQALHRPA